MTGAALSATDLVVRRSRTGAPLLHGVDLVAEAGTLTAVIGRSGAGKSTLLQVLGGIVHPVSGSVSIDGLRIHPARARERRAVGRRLGWVFQEDNLIESLSTRDNVALPLRLRRARGWREAADEALEVVGLGHRGAHRPSEVSGGERQRTAIARLIADPRTVALVDEPTSSLDVVAAEQVHEALRSLASTGTAVVVVTHDLALAAKADRTLLMARRSLADVPGHDVTSLRSRLAEAS